MWHPEKILPIRCPYCNDVFFAVKNFAKRLIEFVDDFEDQPSFHSCQFVWQNFDKVKPMSTIFSLDEDFKNLSAEQDVFFKIKALKTATCGLMWYAKPQQNWVLMQDSGDFITLRQSSSLKLPTLGVLLTWNLNKDKKMPVRPKYSQKVLIKHMQPKYSKIKVVDVIFKADDARKLTQHLSSLIKELKTVGQKPFFLMPKLLIKAQHQAHVRGLTFINNSVTEEFFKDRAVFPSWLLADFVPRIINFKSGFKWD